MNLEESSSDPADKDDTATSLGLKDLMISGDVIGTLDAHSIAEVEALLPEPLDAAIHQMSRLVAANKGGTILLDSDGTNYLRIETGVQDQDETVYRRMLSEGRLMPGGAISGEVPQELTYFYRVSPDVVEVWRRLAQFNVRTGIFSGRKAEQLSEMYKRALDTVDRFMLLPSKGRVVIESGQTNLLGDLREALSDDPMGAVGEKMDEHILELMNDDAARSQAMKLEAESKERERITGYRVSRQKVNDTVVLIRLHHRFRACQLASENGCTVPGIDTPDKVDGQALSQWLFSENEGAKRTMAVLKQEHDNILQSWQETVTAEKYAQMNIGMTEILGGRSLCHDFSPIVNPESVIGSLENEAPLLLYAGDSYKSHGNDRAMMEALHMRSTAGVAVAVHPFNHPEAAEGEDWMVDADQFQLFLAQYTLSRILREASGEGVD